MPATNAALTGWSRRPLAGILVALLLAATHAMAQQAPPANAMSQEASAALGSQGGYCSIVVLQDGQLMPSADFSQLSSQSVGGRPGRAQVTTNRWRFQVSIDPLFGFSVAPVGGNTGVIFNTYMSGSGATGFTNRPGGNSHRLKRGVTNISADLIADRSGEPFPAGQYRAELVLRCE